MSRRGRRRTVHAPRRPRGRAVVPLRRGRDRCDDDNCAGASDARCNPGDSLDVLVAILFRESEPSRKVLTHYVAVEAVHGEAKKLEFSLQQGRDGCLAGAR